MTREELQVIRRLLGRGKKLMVKQDRMRRRVARRTERLRGQERNEAYKQRIEAQANIMKFRNEALRQMEHRSLQGRQLRREIEALFVRYGRAKAEASSLWLQWALGPSLNAIVRDRGALRRLRKQYPGVRLPKV